MRKGDETRRRMIEETAVLLQRQGLNGTGLAEVLTATGLPRGSLYHHFPGGKEELTVEALRLADEVVMRRIDRAWAASAEPADFARALLDRYLRRLERTDFAEGCPVAAVALEGTPQSERLRRASAEALEHWIEAIASRLVAAGDTEERARSKATTVIASMEGALILSRATHDAEPMHQVGAELTRLLGA